jgi:hypothetical protein
VCCVRVGCPLLTGVNAASLQTSGSVFLQGSRGFLNLLCRSLAAYCFWEEIPQSAKDGLEEVDEVQKKKGGFLSKR